MPVNFSILIFLFSIAMAQSGVYMNGNCIYTNGEITENGVTRKATPEEKAKIAEFNRGMDEWGTLFGQWMNEKMSNMFNRNYVAPPQPVAPESPCVCSSSNCKY